MAARWAPSGGSQPPQGPGLRSWEPLPAARAPAPAGGLEQADKSRVPTGSASAFSLPDKKGDRSQRAEVRRGGGGAVGSGPWRERTAWSFWFGKPSGKPCGHWGLAPLLQVSTGVQTPAPLPPSRADPLLPLSPEAASKQGGGWGRCTGRRRAHSSPGSHWAPQGPFLDEADCLLAPEAGLGSPRVVGGGGGGRVGAEALDVLEVWAACSPCSGGGSSWMKCSENPPAACGLDGGGRSTGPWRLHPGVRGPLGCGCAPPRVRCPPCRCRRA